MKGTLEYIEKTSDGWMAFALKDAGPVRGIIVVETFGEAMDLARDNGWVIIDDDCNSYESINGIWATVEKDYE
jgi:hypothetical protein